MSKGICTRSHSPTSRAAAPHPVTTDCLADVERRLTAELARVTQERDEALAKIAVLTQECYDRMEVCIDPSCTYKETLLGVYCQEVVLAILTNREGEQ